MIDVKPYAKQSGIYRIYRLGGSYRECWVGQAGDFYHRWQGHETDFRADENSPILQRAWVKYGGYDSFGWEVLEFAPIECLDEREQFYLDTIRPIYNIAKFAAASHRGVRHTEQGLANLRAAWARRRENGHSQERLAAYERLRGQYTEKMAAATQASQLKAQQAREARDAHILAWLIDQGWDVSQLPFGSRQMALMAVPSLGLCEDSILRSIVRLRNVGAISYPKRGPGRIPKPKGQTTKQRAASLANMQKAIEVCRVMREETGEYPHPPAQWTEKRRQAYEVIKAKGPSERQLAYWARMQGQKRGPRTKGK